MWINEKIQLTMFVIRFQPVNAELLDAQPPATGSRSQTLESLTFKPNALKIAQ